MRNVKQAIIVANGPCEASSIPLLPEDSLQVAVDGGLSHILTRGRLPDLLIGDLDSVKAEDLARCEASGVEILRFPPAKNETDLELGLQAAKERGCTLMRIFCALGGRLDHTLGNLALLFNPQFAGLQLSIEGAGTSLYPLQGPGEATFRSQAGETVSLIPWQGDASGICTSGLAYPLKDETLFAHGTRGISNLAEAETVRVSLKVGALLVIHNHPNTNSKGN